MLLIATAADKKQGYYETLKRQVSRAGMFLLYHELKPFSWLGMLEWQREVADDHANSIVCFVDTWDFLLQGGERDIKDALGLHDFIYHSEATCWPEPHKADLYPPSHTPFRYVNGTGPCGHGDAIAAAIDFGLREFPIHGRESSIFADNDQRFWTDVFLSGRGSIDRDCKLSVSLNACEPSDFTITGGKLRLTSGVTPAFVHANGASKFRYAAQLEALR